MIPRKHHVLKRNLNKLIMVECPVGHTNAWKHIEVCSCTVFVYCFLVFLNLSGGQNMMELDSTNLARAQQHAGERGSASDGLVRASGFNEEFGCFLKNLLFCCFYLAFAWVLLHLWPWWTSLCACSVAHGGKVRRNCMRDFITGRLPHTGLGEPPTWMEAKDLICVCARKGVDLLCNKGVGSTLVQTGELCHWKYNSV